MGARAMQSNTKRAGGDPERARDIAGTNPRDVNEFNRCPLEVGKFGRAGQQIAARPLGVDPFLQGFQRVVVELDATAETIDDLPAGHRLRDVLRIHRTGDRQ